MTSRVRCGANFSMKSHMKPRRNVPRRKPIFGNAGFEQLAGIEHHQVAIELGVDRHFRHDTHAQAQTNVSLDHVGVGGGEYNFRCQAAMTEGFVEFRTTGETEHVRHDRVFGQRFESQLRQLGQRVALRHDHAAVPAVARHHHQVAEQFQGFGGDGEIDGAVSSHLGDLHRRTLVHVQGNVRVLLDEIADHRWQRVTGLSVRGGDRQGAFFSRWRIPGRSA